MKRSLILFLATLGFASASAWASAPTTYACKANDGDAAKALTLTIDGEKIHTDSAHFVGEYHQDNLVGTLPRFQGYKGIRGSKRTPMQIVSKAAVSLRLLRGGNWGELNVDDTWFTCESK